MFVQLIMYCVTCFRPKLKQVQDLIVQTVKNMMSEQFYAPGHTLIGYSKKLKTGPCKPRLIASCSTFDTKVIFERPFMSAHIALLVYI